MITNKNVIAAARNRRGPTTHVAIRDFVKALPLIQFVVPCSATKELYGYTKWVFNEAGLAHAWVKAGLGCGFTDAVDRANERVEKLSLL